MAVLQVEHAGEDAGGDHRGRKTRALLIGPHRDLDGRRRLDAVVVQGADDLEAGQHAEHAVELAAGRLGVEVAAGGERRPRRRSEEYTSELQSLMRISYDIISLKKNSTQ